MNHRDWSSTSLGERARYLMEREGISQNELGRRAGIKPGPMSRIANDRNLVAKRESATIGALADAYGVRFEWLARGRGQPEQADDEVMFNADPYPNRLEAARIARADGGVPEEAVRAALTEVAHHETDPSVLWWLHLIEHYALRLRVPASQKREPSITPVTPSSVRTLRATGSDGAHPTKKK